jgi:hypothetical protein
MPRSVVPAGSAPLTLSSVSNRGAKRSTESAGLDGTDEPQAIIRQEW